MSKHSIRLISSFHLAVSRCPSIQRPAITECFFSDALSVSRGVERTWRLFQEESRTCSGLGNIVDSGALETELQYPPWGSSIFFQVSSLHVFSILHTLCFAWLLFFSTAFNKSLWSAFDLLNLINERASHSNEDARKFKFHCKEIVYLLWECKGGFICSGTWRYF